MRVLQWSPIFSSNKNYRDRLRAETPAQNLTPALAAENLDGIGRCADLVPEDFQNLQFLRKNDTSRPWRRHSGSEGTLFSATTSLAVYLCPYWKKPYIIYIATRQISPASREYVVNINIVPPFAGMLHKSAPGSFTPNRAIGRELWRSPYHAGITRIIGDNNQRLQSRIKRPWTTEPKKRLIRLCGHRDFVRKFQTHAAPLFSELTIQIPHRRTECWAMGGLTCLKHIVPRAPRSAGHDAGFACPSGPSTTTMPRSAIWPMRSARIGQVHSAGSPPFCSAVLNASMAVS